MTPEVLTKVSGVLVSRLSIPGFTTGLAVGHDALSNFLDNLKWANADHSKYLYAGTRGVSRGMPDARRVWQSIPERLRATGSSGINTYLAGFDWSHKKPVRAGGSNAASNGIFEKSSLNRARGARRMTRNEFAAAETLLNRQAFCAAMSATASRVFAGATGAAASGCVFATLEHGLKWQQGRIDHAELLRLIARDTGKSAGSGAAVSGLTVAMALAFPPLIRVATHLTLPLAVMGYCATGYQVARIGVGWYKALH